MGGLRLRDFGEIMVKFKQLATRFLWHKHQERQAIKRPLPWVTFVLTIGLLVIYWLQTQYPVISERFTSGYLLDKPRGQYYRLFTAFFLHGSWEHVIGNVIVLVIVGWRLEQVLGYLRYSLMYLLSGLLSTVVAYAIGDYWAGLIGASGAIYGLVVVATLLLCLYFKNRIVKAYLVWWYGLFLVFNLAMVANSFWNALTSGIAVTLGDGTTISNSAHLGGLIGGVLALLMIGVPRDIGRQHRWLQVSGVIGYLGLIGYLLSVVR